MYADDVYLFVESGKSLQRICDNVCVVMEEYGLKVNEIKSNLVRI